MNIKDKILSANDSPLVKVNVPEWDNVDIYLRPLNGTNRLKLVRLAQKDTSLYGFALVVSVCAEDGNLVFTDADIPALEARNGAVLERLCSEIVRLNGLGVAAVEEAKKN